MILGILPEQGGSLQNWSKAGQGSRFINYYLESYVEDFTEIYYFSYAKEDCAFPPSCFLVKNNLGLHRWLYAILLPFLQARFFKKCDILRIMQMTGEVPAIVAKLLYKTPFVATYGYPYEVFSRGKRERLRPYLFKMRSRLALRFADKIIVTTKVLFDYVSRYVAKDKIFLIPNAVDTAQFRPLASNTKCKTKGVVYVGRLSLMKNIKLLLEAVSLLKKKVKLTIIGDGPLKESLMQQAREMALDVDFKGAIPNQELPLYLNRASIFVLPSVAEGHPKALLEAMSCGLPCIGTDVEGTNTVIVDSVNGLLCKLDAQDLADRIETLLDGEKLAESLGKRAREFILENYDIKAVIKKEITLLKSVVNRL